MDIKLQLASSLPADQQRVLHFVADVADSLGFPIYIVGGSVRDLLLGRTIIDFDITVEGDAIRLAHALAKKQGGKVAAHAKFLTATWSAGDSIEIDLISARKETYEHPGALPTVQRSTINDDLRRRDFTVNAMAIRLDGDHLGELFDPLNGQKDLEQKSIRALHNKSFVDDPTRMFRAIRYSVRYGFELEPETLRLFNDEAKSVLSELSGERLRHEFDLVFSETKPVLMLDKFRELGVLAAIHSVLPKAGHERLAKIKDTAPKGLGEFAIPAILSFKQTMAWVLFLMNLPEENIEEIAERFDFPALLTKATRTAASLQKDLPSFKDWIPSQWTFHLEGLPSIAIYTVWLETSEQSLREYLENWKNVKPFTTGDDLKQLGLTPGSKYKEILSRLRAAWLDGEISTKEEETILRDQLIAQ